MNTLAVRQPARASIAVGLAVFIYGVLPALLTNDSPAFNTTALQVTTLLVISVLRVATLRYVFRAASSLGADQTRSSLARAAMWLIFAVCAVVTVLQTFPVLLFLMVTASGKGMVG